MPLCVYLCAPVSIIAIGRYAILQFLSCRRKRNGKENLGRKKYNKIYIYVCDVCTYKKEANGNKCIELEGGLNATH